MIDRSSAYSRAAACSGETDVDVCVCVCVARCSTLLWRRCALWPLYALAEAAMCVTCHIHRVQS